MRVIGKDLNDFLLMKRSGNLVQNANGTNSGNSKSKSTAMQLKLKRGAPFTHKWPDGTKERYRDVQEGSVTVNGLVRSVRVGFTNREAAGKDRERAAVFIDGRPLVEFCGADDFGKSQIMASIIKVDGKQVRPVQGAPKQYSHLKVDAYQKFVTGPYASSNLAVYCNKDDTPSMIEHALIRWADTQS